MTLSIKEGDLTVSVENPNPDEQFDHAELLLIAALKAIGCCIGGGSAVRAYYHVDPDTLELREDDEILWQLYQKYNLEGECKMNCVKQEYSFIFVTHSNNERRSRFQHLQGTDP